MRLIDADKLKQQFEIWRDRENNGDIIRGGQ